MRGPGRAATGSLPQGTRAQRWSAGERGGAPALEYLGGGPGPRGTGRPAGAPSNTAAVRKQGPHHEPPQPSSHPAPTPDGPSDQAQSCLEPPPHGQLAVSSLWPRHSHRPSRAQIPHFSKLPGDTSTSVSGRGGDGVREGFLDVRTRGLTSGRPSTEATAGGPGGRWGGGLGSSSGPGRVTPADASDPSADPSLGAEAPWGVS